MERTIDDLPNEILSHIISYSRPFLCRFVCRHWRAISNDLESDFLDWLDDAVNDARLIEWARSQGANITSDIWMLAIYHFGSSIWFDTLLSQIKHQTKLVGYMCSANTTTRCLVEILVETNNVVGLEWMDRNRFGLPRRGRFIELAVAYNRPEVLKWVLLHKRDRGIKPGKLAKAARFGHLEILQCAYDCGWRGSATTQRIFDTARTYEHWHVADWLRKVNPTLVEK